MFKTYSQAKRIINRLINKEFINKNLFMDYDQGIGKCLYNIGFNTFKDLNYVNKYLLTLIKNKLRGE
jgi:hypothetical protein